ncbi:MAG: 4'-phosphopantetheinyl transferase superfamily protein [Crocinitomicaceae bacterium]|nr:4'-phosphopantetheinyl transferase superfamily protein [Crocinitomicaceae bacterium]
MQLTTLNQITDNRKHLLIREIENYRIRLRNEEKKRDIEKEEALVSVAQLGFESPINYKKTGQPYLENFPDLHLSISHSKGWIAVYISDKPIGIDIEFENPRIMYGVTYYINKDEEQFIDTIQDLHIVWGAKEAFYKWKEGKIADSKNDITITNINRETNQVSVQFENETYLFDFLQEGEITIVLN